MFSVNNNYKCVDVKKTIQAGADPRSVARLLSVSCLTRSVKLTELLVSKIL